MRVGSQGSIIPVTEPRRNESTTLGSFKRWVLGGMVLVVFFATACEPIDQVAPNNTLSGSGKTAADASIASDDTMPIIRETTTPRRPTTTVPAPPTTLAPAAASEPTAPAAASGFDQGGEALFLRLVNDERSQVGVGALRLDGGLINKARSHARWMADNDNLKHQSLRNLIGPPWTTMAENIAYGPTVETMHDGLVDSHGHYVNMVNPSYTHIGIGVYTDARGRTWTAHLFGG